jgi:hypothetical protein
VWRCGKCDGADVPEHKRFCSHRDTPPTVKRVLVVVWPPTVKRVLVVVWPPFGRVRRRGPA